MDHDWYSPEAQARIREAERRWTNSFMTGGVGPRLSVPNPLPRRAPGPGKPRLPRRASLLRRQSVVYFIRAEQMAMIKIGFSNGEPDRRLVALQTGSPCRLELMGVVRGDEDTERRFHARYLHLHSHGEWFHESPELLRMIRRIAKSWPLPDA